MTTTAVVDNSPVHDAPRAPQAPVDTSVVIPEAVRRAAEIANNYYKKPPEPAQGEQPAATGETAPQSAEGEQPAAPPVPEPAQVTAPVTPPAPEAPVSAPDDGSWEHKFKSQQGRIVAQNNTIRQMQDQMADMGSELSRAVQTVEQYQRQAAAPQQQHQRLITDEEQQIFGEDFINVARKAAQETLSPEVEAVRQEVASLRQEQYNAAKRAMYATLGQQVPDWRAINHNSNFKRWLGLRDPLSGVIRKVLLDGATNAADAARVIAVFKGFVADDAASRPADPASLTPPPAPVLTPAPVRQPVMALENLAAPGRARSVPAHAATTEKPTYTNRDIAKFYENSRKGAFAGRDAEYNAIQADIFAAQREGRVRG